MDISPAGLNLVKEFEQLRLTAYRDSGGQLTIGWGSTVGVYAGMRISPAEADARLHNDLRTAVSAVNRYVTVPLTPYQFDALVSLTFNIGVGAFRGSTLLKRLNASRYTEAADQFLRWNKVNGRVSRGLLRRRTAERALFMRAD